MGDPLPGSGGMLVVAPSAPKDAAGLASLFEACGSSCHCRYWHFEGTKNDWLERCAFGAEENRAAMQAALLTGDDTGRGLVASRDGVVVGWMKVAPRGSVPKLRNLPVYRRLDLGPDDGVYSIGCLLVHPEHRHHGVARQMVEGAKAIVRGWNGRAIEAYPHAIDRTMYDEEAWMGPAKMFADAGFVPVAGEAPYPVLRFTL